MSQKRNCRVYRRSFRRYLGGREAGYHFYKRTCHISPWADPEGADTGGLNPPEKSLNIGFLSNTGPDPLKNYKSKLEFNVGPSSARQRNAI